MLTLITRPNTPNIWLVIKDMKSVMEQNRRFCDMTSGHQTCDIVLDVGLITELLNTFRHLLPCFQV